MIKFLIVLLMPSLSLAAVSLDSSKTGKFPIRTSIASCTIVATPADADMVVVGSKCYRDGKFLHVATMVEWNGAGTAGNFTISIASVAGSPVIDATALPNNGVASTNKNEDVLDGFNLVFNVGGSWLIFAPVYKSSTTIEFVLSSVRLQGNSYASGSAAKINLKLPIVGWN
jgi:hypothetical protein